MAKENPAKNKGKKGDYTADDIYILEGLEPVRKKAGHVHRLYRRGRTSSSRLGNF